MIQLSTIQFLKSHLYRAMEFAVGEELRTDDFKPIKNKEARLCQLFVNNICRSSSGYFRMSDSGVLWVYNGKWYESATTKTFLKLLVYETLRELNVGLVYQSFSAKKIADECMDAMENGMSGRFKADHRYIVFNNGVFDVKNGRLRDFSVDYQTDLIMGIDYDSEKRFALWEKKLVEIIPVEGMRNALQMFCGMLIGDRDETKFEYACFIQGPGSNGKSVIASTIANVFGTEHFGKFEPKQLLKATNSEFAMAALDGMIANFTDDLSRDDVSGGMFKKFVSGEEFPARHPYGRTFFKVKAPMMLCCCNEMPSTTDDSWGYHRRILAITSTEKVLLDGDKERDSNLTAKLASPEARMAVFNWIYQGYRNVMANDGNIKFDATVVDRQLELRDDSNSARRWMRDAGMIRVDPVRNDTRWKTLADWHKEYRQYCEDMGDRSPQTAKSVAKLFREKGYATRSYHGCTQFCIGKIENWGEEASGMVGMGGEEMFASITLPDNQLPF